VWLWPISLLGLIASDARTAEAHGIYDVKLIAMNSGKCLDIVGGFGTSGTPTHLWFCVGVPWQVWDIVPYDSTWHFIVNYANRYACFKDWGPKGVQLGYLTRLGDVGRATYSVFRSPCAD